MSLPDLNLLVALNVLLEEGSVAAAARRMHLSAPAMSHTLGRIREAVGDPIMVRAGRRLVPTPRALALREEVRELVEQATRLFHSGEHFDLTGLERCFTLRANNVLVGDMAARLLEELRHEAPRCTLRFVPEVDHDDEALRRNRIDLFIGARPGLEPEAQTQRLFSTRFVGLARRDHPLFDGSASTRRALAFLVGLAGDLPSLEVHLLNVQMLPLPPGCHRPEADSGRLPAMMVLRKDSRAGQC